MKRAMADDGAAEKGEDKKMKKIRVEGEEAGEEKEEGEGEGEGERGTGFVNLDENLLYEVLKHVDARTLGAAACVSKLWHRTAQDERLWEMICTRHGATITCPKQLRSVVLALGGFRRLHSQFLCHLSKPQSSGSSSPSTSSSSSWGAFAPMIGSKPVTRWGKDEVNLSLSLLSIRYYEKMNFNNRGR